VHLPALRRSELKSPASSISMLGPADIERRTPPLVLSNDASRVVILTADMFLGFVFMLNAIYVILFIIPCPFALPFAFRSRLFFTYPVLSCLCSCPTLSPQTCCSLCRSSLAFLRSFLRLFHAFMFSFLLFSSTFFPPVACTLILPVLPPPLDL
jgi:hypothetical protein